MKLVLQRLGHDADSTLGALYIDGKLVAGVCEDEPRAVKVPGKTRIPAGTYRVTLRTEGGFHARYAQQYGARHKGMLWLRDVPGFEYILIHIGNTQKDTAGCLLVGALLAVNTSGGGAVQQSTTRYWEVYPGVAAALERGESVTIVVRDEVAWDE